MKRIPLFEFEDYPWLPSFIRVGITRLLAVLHRLMGTSTVLAGLLAEIRTTIAYDQIVDLGSGSGGPMPEVIDLLNSGSSDPPVSLILTDKYPNPNTVSQFNAEAFPHTRYLVKPVDARDLNQTPSGLKTMIASFHHMHPKTARAILESAAQNKQPLLIYELAQNNIPTLLWWLLLPLSLVILFLMTWVMTPFVRPLTWKQLLFTYLIPVIPIVYAWDGQASLMRTYTFKDLESLLPAQKQNGYSWKMQEVRKANGKSAGYYLFGAPEHKESF